MTKSVLNKHKAERFCATSGSGVGLTENERIRWFLSFSIG